MKHTPLMTRRTAGTALLAALAWPTVQAGLPEVVATAKPSVLPVGLFNALSSPRFTFRGTGFAVADGRVLATNAHVVPEESADLERLAIQLTGNRRPTPDAPIEVRRLTVITIDRTHDLALLRIEGEPLPTLTLSDAPAREGQSVAFMGFPIGGVLGFAPVVHRATVSSIAPIVLPPPNAARLDAAQISRLRAGPFDILQLDGTAYPGNSGGPLIDPDTGAVLGVINMVLVKAGRENLLSQPSGISYAIPVQHLRDLLARR
ncbi:MAG: serine protease [Burkholderiales bacterium PBB5]|nr:MAG: serine protease [Burkholderiales bacterium PBB5]